MPKKQAPHIQLNLLNPRFKTLALSGKLLLLIERNLTIENHLHKLTAHFHVHILPTHISISLATWSPSMLIILKLIIANRILIYFLRYFQFAESIVK